MFKAFLLILLVGFIVSSSRSSKKKKKSGARYDMQCNCGLRHDDELSKNDCESSAKLENSNQATNHMIDFDSFKSLS